jgi:hypothetical protein
VLERTGPRYFLIGVIVAAVLVAVAGTTLLLRRANKSSVQSPTRAPLGTPEKLSSLFDGTSTVRHAANLDSIASAYNVRLTPGQADYLERNKFLLVPLSQSNHENFDDMLSYFDEIGGDYSPHQRAPQNTKLVTPDIVLHAYHKYFDLTLKELERDELLRLLKTFLSGLANNATQAATQAPADIAVRYQNILAEINVARTLLENKGAPRPDYFSDQSEEEKYLANDQAVDTFDNAKAIFLKYSPGLASDLTNKGLEELRLIYAADSAAGSPLWGQYADGVQADYTQYVPRSHYAEDSGLRAYFRTMMYLGRNSYLFGKDVGIKDANLVMNLFSVTDNAGNAPFLSWRRLKDITDSYAGKTDDITFNEWQSFVNVVLGSPQQTPQDLVGDSALKKLKDNINLLRKPKILADVVRDPRIGSLTKEDLLNASSGLRIFGQKFSFDAWILNDLTAGQESSPVRLPSTPTALFVPAALGDSRARSYVSQFLENEKGFSSAEIAGFMSRLDAKSKELRKIKPEEWSGSLGGAWLNLLGTLGHQYDDKAYPAYMRSEVFPDKQIQTFLGSYTELKHDTLLYTKQSYAEQGGGDEEESPLPPIVKGFVEPNLAFWKKLVALIDRTEQTFRANNVFQNHSAMPRLQEFKKIVSFFAELAEKELQGKALTDDEYEKLRTLELSFMAVPFGNSDQPHEDSGKVALIADLHTDAVGNKVLYEATGEPYLMIAFVDNENSPRLVVGLVFNHYEFTGNTGTRLTDEDWKKLVYETPSSLPIKPFSYSTLVPK